MKILAIRSAEQKLLAAAPMMEVDGHWRVPESITSFFGIYLEELINHHYQENGDRNGVYIPNSEDPFDFPVHWFVLEDTHVQETLQERC
jgi:hypothetical protein